MPNITNQLHGPDTRLLKGVDAGSTEERIRRALQGAAT